MDNLAAWQAWQGLFPAWIPSLLLGLQWSGLAGGADRTERARVRAGATWKRQEQVLQGQVLLVALWRGEKEATRGEGEAFFSGCELACELVGSGGSGGGAIRWWLQDGFLICAIEYVGT